SRGRNRGERRAINGKTKERGADLIKRAMLTVPRRLRKENRQAKMLLSVHDELVFEAPPKEVPALAKLVQEEMVGAMKLDVPLEVEIAAGRNWLEVQDLN